MLNLMSSVLLGSILGGASGLLLGAALFNTVRTVRQRKLAASALRPLSAHRRAAPLG